MVRAPVRGSYRGHEVSVQPPVSQALIAPMVLRALEQSGAGEPADRAHVSVEAIEAAFRYRHEIAADGVEDRLMGVELEIDRGRRSARGPDPRAPHHLGHGGRLGRRRGVDADQLYALSLRVLVPEGASC